jgi:hypothetical protein
MNGNHSIRIYQSSYRQLRHWCAFSHIGLINKYILRQFAICRTYIVYGILFFVEHFENFE